MCFHYAAGQACKYPFSFDFLCRIVIGSKEKQVFCSDEQDQIIGEIKEGHFRGNPRAFALDSHYIPALVVFKIYRVDCASHSMSGDTQS